MKWTNVMMKELIETKLLPTVPTLLTEPPPITTDVPLTTLMPKPIWLKLDKTSPESMLPLLNSNKEELMEEENMLESLNN